MSKGLIKSLKQRQLLLSAPVMPDGIPTAERFALKYRKDKGQQNENSEKAHN
jgi:hypothetical protein